MRMKQVAINTPYITLGQLVKLTGLADSGSEAKLRIQDGQFKVNGEIELRRGRKLYPGDCVEGLGQKFQVSQ